jgi:hypothetical protein
MFEQLDPGSPTPLYAHIAYQLKVAIAAGELRPAESLPSARQLAALVRVNPEASIWKSGSGQPVDRRVCMAAVQQEVDRTSSPAEVAR